MLGTWFIKMNSLPVQSSAVAPCDQERVSEVRDCSKTAKTGFSSKRVARGECSPISRSNCCLCAELALKPNI